MIRLIAVSAFALTVATSAQAMSPAPLHQPDGITTEVAVGCGVGKTRVNGVCVAITTKRQVRRAAAGAQLALLADWPYDYLTAAGRKRNQQASQMVSLPGLGFVSESKLHRIL